MIVQCNRNPEPIEKTETKTVTTTRVDTVRKTKTVKVNRPIPVKETITKTVHDTLPVTQITHSRDTVFASVEVPVSPSKYSGKQTLSDSTKVSYVANVSGHKSSLDSLSFRVEYPERQINTNTVTTTTSTKKKHWGIGPAIGFGYGLVDKKWIFSWG